MSAQAFLENRPFRMSGDYKATGLKLTSARVEEGISLLGGAAVEFVSRDRNLELKKVVGNRITLELDGASHKRKFSGLCVEAEFIGLYRDQALCVAEVRPWLWFLTRNRDSRVFQGKSTPDILQDVLSERGFWGNVDKKLSGKYPARDLCIQYRESDFDFISRLMEEDGMYYYFTHDGGVERMVLADAPGAHVPTPTGTVPFQRHTIDLLDNFEHIFEWNAAERATTGKVSLRDYNFENPKAKLEVANGIPLGSHPRTDYEAYDFPGHYVDAGEGARLARIKMESEAVRHQIWRGAGNLCTLGVGQTFKLKDHPGPGDSAEYTLTRAVHHIRIHGDMTELTDAAPQSGRMIDFATDDRSIYRCDLEAVPKQTQYRAPLVTPWPQVSSIQTALVVGPAGEEIHTDEYGRVKVQFHWDRKGAKDDKSMVFVRTMMPWTGKNWGMIHVPRIGQEVVVQFEDGNVDRPVIIGMLYNGDNMPPYDMKSNATQSGVKTNSSKGGNGFNELMFEDKKGAELVRFRSEKDYEQIVQNNSTTTVGLDKTDKGDMSLTVQQNLTELVKKGDHKFTVQTGNQTIAIKSNKTETIEGKSTLTVTGDVTETVKMGNVSETVKMGNVTRKIEMGNETTTLTLGNFKLKADLGRIDIEAMQEICLKVGGSTVTINQMGVTIKGMMITEEAQLMHSQKALLTEVKGDALLILKGGLTLIN